ncbi:AraC family transcriptional regulator [Nocardia sp. bgisy118]|uniref:AraC family transcriptional regulator n=1 Tax=Nocardia sp. bgisy118 TaxID=3413786 RepID=UPI003F4A119D
MTTRLNMPRSIASAAILVELAMEHGMTVEQCLDGTGIAPAALPDPESEILARQELRLVHNLVTAIGHVPALGLEAGRRYPLFVHGIWAFAVISSPTVRHAWRIGVDHIDIGYSFARWRFEVHAGDGVATIDDSAVPAGVRTFLLERDIAEMAAIAKEVFGGTVTPTRVELACPPPPYADQFGALLGMEPEFDAPVTKVVMAQDLLDLPLPQANPYTAAFAERQAAEIMQQRRKRQGLAAQVREALLTLGVASGLDEVAAELRMSTRTLRRRLTDEGTSYRELVAETRQMLAEELLSIGATVEDVAGRLGYSDASSFTHAFTRWTGVTPGRFARAAR